MNETEYRNIEPGRYEAVALVDPEPRETRTGRPYHGAQFVVMTPGKAQGAVLFAYLSLIPAARFLWEGAGDHPTELDGRRVIINVIEESGMNEQTRMRITRVLPIRVPTTIEKFGRTYRLEEE